jgi:hypothetical protein
MAQSGIGSSSPAAAINAMVVDCTPAPSEITLSGIASILF